MYACATLIDLTCRVDCIHLSHMSTKTHTPHSFVLSVRIRGNLKESLEALSRSTKRSRAYLATEALADYVKKNAWKASELHAAIKEADKGVFISHERMVEWVNARARGKNAQPPKPDIFLKHRAS